MFAYMFVSRFIVCMYMQIYGYLYIQMYTMFIIYVYIYAYIEMYTTYVYNIDIDICTLLVCLSILYIYTHVYIVHISLYIYMWCWAWGSWTFFEATTPRPSVSMRRPSRSTSRQERLRHPLGPFWWRASETRKQTKALSHIYVVYTQISYVTHICIYDTYMHVHI